MTMKTALPFESFWSHYDKTFYVLPEHLLSGIAEADLIKDDFWFSPVGSGPLQVRKATSRFGNHAGQLRRLLPWARRSSGTS